MLKNVNHLTLNDLRNVLDISALENKYLYLYQLINLLAIPKLDKIHYLQAYKCLHIPDNVDEAFLTSINTLQYRWLSF